MNRRIFAAGLAGFVTLVASQAGAWPGTEVYPGVTYEHRSGLQDYGSGDYPQEIYITYVESTHPSVSFIATKSAQRGAVVSSFASTAGAAVALNTNFFGGGFQPCGMMMGDGELWTDAYQGSVEGSCSDTLAIGPVNDVGFFDTWGIPNGPAPAGAHEIATGMPTLVRGGTIVPQAELESSAYPDHMATAQPRTALCMHEDGSTLILAVVDGRESGVRTGMRAITLATFMKGLGCYDAINLDGGGSSTMFVEGQTPYPGRPTGVVNRTSDGQERGVCCHLGVRIDPNPPQPDAGPEAGPEAGDDAAAEAGTDAPLETAVPDAEADGAPVDAATFDAASDAGPTEGGAGAETGTTRWSNDEASGCACRASKRSSNGEPWWIAALLALMAVLRRRGQARRVLSR